jgi:hypothetical protein
MVKNISKKKNKSVLKLASYGTAKIYKTNQVRLKSSLLNTLGIHPGDRVEIFLDTERRVIVLKSLE